MQVYFYFYLEPNAIISILFNNQKVHFEGIKIVPLINNQTFVPSNKGLELVGLCCLYKFIYT